MATRGFSPTPQEQALVAAVFAIADPQKSGVVQGEPAVQVLNGANLPPATLGMIWQIADDENNGFLTRKGVGAAIRLIGYAQRGETVHEDLLKNPGPTAKIKGLPLQAAAVAHSPPPKSPPPIVTHDSPPLTTEDRAKFMRMFVGFGPVGGLLTAEKSKDVFVRSKLPLEKLGQIWNLADTQSRGALDSTDFVLGMYFIQCCMTNPRFVLPTSLPPGLYQQAAGTAYQPSAIRTHATGDSNGFNSPAITGAFPTTPVKPQLTGQPLRHQYTGQPIVTHHTGQALPVHYTGQSLQSNPAASRLSANVTGSPFPNAAAPPAASQWDITPQEKANADTFFNELDKHKVGYIEGDVAVQFMIKSQLPEAALAQIWDLADMNKDGRLTQDGFAVALHLINGKLTGKEIPSALPLSLIPPSQRPGAGAPQPSEQMKDLWSLEDTPPSSAVQPNFQPPPKAASPPPPIPARFTAPPPSHFSLLDDDEAAAQPRAVPNNSVEIGNIQNQLNSTTKSLDSTRAERQSLETNINHSALTLSQLESQLASAKAAYETETRLLSDLKDRFATQSSQISKTREELIRAESDLSAMRLEKSEVEGAVLRDKEDVRELQRKMKVAGEEVEVLKKDIEKAKKDARHQKGLLAINRKQLAAAEADRQKAEKELEAAKEEVTEAEAEVAASEVALKEASRAASPPPAAPSEPANVALPVSPISTGSKNPFDKFTSGSAGGTPMTTTAPFSPFALPDIDLTTPTAHTGDPFGFDNAFGNIETPEQSKSVPTAMPDDPFGFHTAFATAAALTPTPPIASQIPSPAPQEPSSLMAKAVESQPETTTPSFMTAPESAGFPATPMADVDLAATHFPALDEQPMKEQPVKEQLAKEQPAKDQNAKGDTELPPMTDIEVEDDSSDDDDSDDYMAARQHKGAAAQPAAVDKPADSAAVPNGSADSSPTPRAVSPEANTASTFDAVFGSAATSSIVEVSPPGSHVDKSGEAPPALKDGAVGSPLFGASGPVLGHPFSEEASQAAKPPAGDVSVFDEAFGTKPAAANGGQFKFDSAFDDPFDFATFTPAAAAAAAAPQETVPAKMPGADPFGAPTTGTNTAGPAAAPTFSFDDAFGSAAPGSAAAAPAQSQGNAFDEAFDVLPTYKPLENHISNPTTASPAPAFAPPPARAPVAVTPASPATTRTSESHSVAPSTSQRTIDSARSRSPSEVAGSMLTSTPPRTRSPKPSNAAMRTSRYEPPPGVPPPPAEPPAKHSRFHLPLFGRSKTTKKPAATRGKSPAPSRGGSAANSPVFPPPVEDVEGVKQICNMGFTRDQAVAALERHNYNVALAINYLVEGSPST